MKPFGFLLAFSAKPNWGGELIVADKPKRRKKPKPVKPIAPFDRDLQRAALAAFDRETGERVSADCLKYYAETLAQYHLHPESKFLNGNHLSRGMTERRHVRVTAVRHIGKESQDWEMQAVLGLDPDAGPEYGSDFDRNGAFARLTALVGRAGQRKVAKALKTTPGKLARMRAETLPRCVADRLPAAMKLLDRLRGEQDRRLQGLREAVERDGLRATARRLSIDASNLRRKLKCPV